MLDICKAIDIVTASIDINGETLKNFNDLRSDDFHEKLKDEENEVLRAWTDLFVALRAYKEKLKSLEITQNWTIIRGGQK